MNRRSFLQGVLALAALGPLARRVVAEELERQRREAFIQRAFYEGVHDVLGWGGVKTEDLSTGYPRVTAGPGYVCIQNAESATHWLAEA